MKKPLYQHIATKITALQNCRSAGNEEWAYRHAQALRYIDTDLLPSGSGIDAGCSIDTEASKPQRLVIKFSYHHMDGHGFYNGWTDHKAIITPSLQFGYNLKITGRDINQLKDYLHEVFSTVLDHEVSESQLHVEVAS